MPTLRKIVATPNTDRPMYQKNIGSGQVERGVHQRVGVGVAARAARDARSTLVVVARAARTPRRAAGGGAACFTFQRPATCSITSFESPRTCDARAPASPSAASSPAISARYSATLLVVSPMRSLTAARRAGGALDGSSTTAPIAAGPGFPRAPPSK